MIYSFENNTVYRQDGTQGKSSLATFSDPVLKLVEFSNGLCVLTEPNSKATRATNLFMLDRAGKIHWSATATFSAGDKNVFVDAKVDPSNPDQVMAWDWDGNRYVLSASGGAEVSKEFLK